MDSECIGPEAYYPEIISGNLDTIKALSALKIPFGSDTGSHAIKSGNLQVVQLLESLGYKFSEWDYRYIYTNKTAELAEYLLTKIPREQIEYIWTEGTCANAARAGNLQMLVWLVEHGIPADIQVYSEAAAVGHQEIILWALGRKIPCDTTCYQALLENHRVDSLKQVIPMIKWMRANGLPWDPNAIVEYAIRYGRGRVYLWAENSGMVDYQKVLEYAIKYNQPILLETIIKLKNIHPNFDAYSLAIQLDDQRMLNYLFKLGILPGCIDYLLFQTMDNCWSQSSEWLMEYRTKFGDLI